jgi:eukaryotic-like serine/threonine-protein kinase
MPAESINEPDDAFVKALVALDEAATVGQGLASASDILNDPGQRERFERAKGTLDVLAEFWPRHLPTESSETLSLVLGPLASEQGRFGIVRELGRGGWGIVFQAHDRVLSRQVALKVPRPEVLLTSDNRKRFLKEAKIAAKLNHPSLVPLYDAGESGHFCYLVSAYCEGPTLAVWLRERTEPVPCREAARLLGILAEAVEYMHGQGILHRDLKPSNILMASVGRKPSSVNYASDTPLPESLRPPLDKRPFANLPLTHLQPKITDFGLAAFQEGETMPTGLGGLTRTGALIGTPTYMAPEQADGRNKDIGPHTDVHALGVILYELLTGKPPFTSDSDVQTRLKVVSEDPRRPRLQRRDIPRDLETICLKCLEKDSARRYQAAAALAADLTAFAENRPIQARSRQAKRTAKKWLRHYWLPAIILLNAGLVAWLLLTNKKPPATPRTADPLAERREYVQKVRKAFQVMNDPKKQDEAPVLIESFKQPLAFETEWLASRLYRPEGRQVIIQKSALEALAVDVRSKQLAVGIENGDIQIRDTESGEVKRHLPGHGFAVNALAFCPRTNVLASGGKQADGKIELIFWDFATNEQLYRKSSEGSAFDRCMAFSNDGKAFLALELDGENSHLALWNMTDPKHPGPPKRIPRPNGPTTITSFTFTPDDRFVLLGTKNSVIEIWDVNLEKMIKTLDLGSNGRRAITTLRFSPSGDSLAASDFNGRIWLCDGPVTKILGAIQCTDAPLWDIDFDPDPGSPWMVAASGKRGLVFVCNRRSQKVLRSLSGHEIKATHVAPLADSWRFVSTGSDGRLIYWDLNNWNAVQELPGHTPKEAWASAFSPDGKFLATGGDDHLVRLWDAKTGDDRGVLDGSDSLVSFLAFSPDGTILAGASFDSYVTLWEVNTRKVMARLPVPDYARSVMFTRDGNYLVACGGGNQSKLKSNSFLYIWDVGHKAVVRQFENLTGIYNSCVLTPDDSQVVIRPNIHIIRFYNIVKDTWHTWDADEELTSLSVSPTGDILATGDKSGRLRVWDMANGEIRATYNLHGPAIRAVAFSPDGKTLATGSDDSLVRLWDVATLEPFYALDGHDKRVNSVAFSPDGSMLASVSHDGEVHIWRTGVPLKRTK